MTCTNPADLQNQLVLSVLKLFTVALGIFIVYLAWRAYGARKDRTTLWLTVGMAILTLSSISEGAAYQGLCWSIDQSHIASAVVTLLGFAVLVYSLYARR